MESAHAPCLSPGSKPCPTGAQAAAVRGPARSVVVVCRRATRALSRNRATGAWRLGQSPMTFASWQAAEPPDKLSRGHTIKRSQSNVLVVELKPVQESHHDAARRKEMARIVQPSDRRQSLDRLLSVWMSLSRVIRKEEEKQRTFKSS